MAGSASTGEVWFLLEYEGVWERKAFEQSQIPEDVKAHLAAAVQAIPKSRVLMIKSRPGLLESGIRFYVAVSSARRPFLYEFHFEEYEEILSLDLIGIVIGDSPWEPALRTLPLFLVCTNGRRDACCAKFGLAVYDAFQDVTGTRMDVWQTSHVGGHRFAPNVVVMPEGIYYGRVQPEDALGLVGAHLRGEYFLDHLRGRVIYPPVVQGAEILLRRETGRVIIDEFKFVNAHEESPGLWRVVFSSEPVGPVYRLKVSQSDTGELVRTGCFTDEAEPVVRFDLIDLKIDK